MENIIEEILKDEFVKYSKVYELAAKRGMSKRDVKIVKERLDVKTITLVNGDERLWLWYIPKNVWNRFLSEK